MKKGLVGDVLNFYYILILTAWCVDSTLHMFWLIIEHAEVSRSMHLIA